VKRRWEVPPATGPVFRGNAIVVVHIIAARHNRCVQAACGARGKLDKGLPCGTAPIPGLGKSRSWEEQGRAGSCVEETGKYIIPCTVRRVRGV
jgi:hypothetical protein